MRMGQFITIEDWNEMGLLSQLALRDGLNFLGILPPYIYYPPPYIHSGILSAEAVIGLYPDGMLTIGNRAEFDTRFTLEDALAFIELTSFGVRE